MKHVRRPATELPALAEYRAANPTDDSAPAAESSAVWERFRGAPAYKTLLDERMSSQQGLCLYCEQRLVDAHGKRVHQDYQVEHVLAKSGATGRVLDWTNLALACGGGTYPHHADASRRGTGAGSESCGQRKDDRDLPTGCDPRAFPVSPRLAEVGLDGSIRPDAAGCAAASVGAPELQTAIDEVLNLNCERLRVARQKTGDNIRGWIVPVLEDVLAASHLDAAQRRAMIELMVAGRLQPDANGCLRAFWTTEVCGLGESGDTWVAQNQALFS